MRPKLCQTLSLAVVAVSLIACGEAPAADRHSAQDAPAASPPQPVERIPGTPPGGLTDWVAEIRAGIAGLSASLPAETDAVRKKAMDLYLTRQEFIEMYYGPTGRLAAVPALGQAVRTAEERFHDLLRAVGETPPSAPAVAAAAQALDAQLAVVLQEAEKAAVPMTPPPAAEPAQPGSR